MGRWLCNLNKELLAVWKDTHYVFYSRLLAAGKDRHFLGNKKNKNITNKNQRRKKIMASIVMVIGQSGTGKSTSLRNFKKGECSIVNVSRKPMPFRCDIPIANVSDYKTIKELLARSESPSIVIDDCSYLIVNSFMAKADIKGYDKFTELAKDFWELINFCINELPDNKIVYFLGHSERGEDGREHFKTVGKMLDNVCVLEGYCTVVLKTVVEDGNYYFATRNNGYDTVKTPMGMFEHDRIPNDLKAVDDQVRKYFNLSASKPVEKDTKKTETKKEGDK